MTNSYDNQIDAEIAAKHVANSNGFGYAFAIEWADHWSVENRKPNFRGLTSTGRSTLVVEVRNTGERLWA